MAITHKDISLLTQKATIAGTEKIPVSDTEYVTTNQIASLGGSGGGGGGGAGVSDVTLGGTSVVTNGVASLPAYPTTLPASDVSAWAKAATKPSYTASEVGALPSSTPIPSALSDLTDDVVSGHYLPLTGGTITGGGNSEVTLSNDSVIVSNGGSGSQIQTVSIGPSSMAVRAGSQYTYYYRTSIQRIEPGQNPYNINLPSASGTLALTSDIPSALSELSDDSTHRLVTDTEKSTWNAKQNAITVSSSEPTSSQGSDGDIWIVI